LTSDQRILFQSLTTSATSASATFEEFAIQRILARIFLYGEKQKIESREVALNEPSATFCVARLVHSDRFFRSSIGVFSLLVDPGGDSCFPHWRQTAIVMEGNLDAL
jgi:hypothetical protein